MMLADELDLSAAHAAEEDPRLPVALARSSSKDAERSDWKAERAAARTASAWSSRGGGSFAEQSNTFETGQAEAPAVAVIPTEVAHPEITLEDWLAPQRAEVLDATEHLVQLCSKVNENHTEEVLKARRAVLHYRMAVIESELKSLEQLKVKLQEEPPEFEYPSSVVSTEDEQAAGDDDVEPDNTVSTGAEMTAPAAVQQASFVSGAAHPEAVDKVKPGLIGTGKGVGDRHGFHAGAEKKTGECPVDYGGNWQLHKFWDIQQAHMAPTCSVHCIEDPDSILLVATASSDRSVVVHAMLDDTHENPGGTEPTFVGLVPCDSPVRAVALLHSPDDSEGSFLTAAGGDMDDVLVWTQQGTADGDDPWLKLPVPGAGRVVSMATDHVGRHLAAAADKVVLLWKFSDHAAPQGARELFHNGRVNSIKIPHRDTLVSLSNPSTDPGRAGRVVTRWDLRQPTPASKIITHPTPKECVLDPGCLDTVFDAVVEASTGNLMLALAAGFTFHAWDMRRTKEPVACSDLQLQRPASAIALDAAGSQLVAIASEAGSGSTEGNILLGSLAQASSTLLFGPCLGGPSAGIASLQWAPTSTSGSIATLPGKQRSIGGSVLVAGLADGALWSGYATAA